jgi:hypothetical protein
MAVYIVWLQELGPLKLSKLDSVHYHHMGRCKFILDLYELILTRQLRLKMESHSSQCSTLCCIHLC